jgi:hypothetical protein
VTGAADAEGEGAVAEGGGDAFGALELPALPGPELQALRSIAIKATGTTKIIL